MLEEFINRLKMTIEEIIEWTSSLTWRQAFILIVASILFLILILLLSLYLNIFRI
ncbi:hypothetical protein MmiEs2_03650 [Methanimicrococcus stummii]|uniref:Uncharacterized protein n=1 Tax=Methanimicrococcus stummii TaxID=3028294 RepID=A0AA96V7I1_9EURY|nr:hypothetical protein MmiEs2_03650 [Methanimicrococcus sp. Es2]